MRQLKLCFCKGEVVYFEIVSFLFRNARRICERRSRSSRPKTEQKNLLIFYSILFPRFTRRDRYLNTLSADTNEIVIYIGMTQSTRWSQNDERTIDSLATNSTASIYRASLGDDLDKPQYQNKNKIKFNIKNKKFKYIKNSNQSMPYGSNQSYFGQFGQHGWWHRDSNTPPRVDQNGDRVYACLTEQIMESYIINAPRLTSRPNGYCLGSSCDSCWQ